MKNCGLFHFLPSGDILSSAGPQVLVSFIVKRLNIAVALFYFHCMPQYWGTFAKVSVKKIISQM